MAEWLLLRIPRDAAQAPVWLLADARGQLLSAPAGDTGPALAAAAAGRRVALIVPAADVVSLSATLPQGNDARLQQLAPYALEDQVSEDVDSLHFALGARDAAAGQVPVRVVARALLEGWLERAREWSLTPQAVYADSDLAPLLPGHLTLLLDGDLLVLRMEGRATLVLPATDPLLALDLLLEPGESSDNLHVVVHAAPDGWQRFGPVIESLRERVATMKVQLSSGGILPVLAQSIAAPDRINLLQGTYRIREESGSTWRRWRVAAALAGALLLLFAGGRFWDLRQLQASERALDAALEQAAAVALPGETLGGNLRRRVEQRLQATAEGGQGQWLHLLSAVAAAHDNVPLTTVEGLAFKSGELTLRVKGPDAASLEQFSQALRAGGYSANVASGTVQGDAFAGRIDLTGPGS